MSDRARRQYSDADKATALAALDANGGDVRQTARDTGIPKSTIANWSHERGVSAAVSQLGDAKKKSLADQLEEVAEKLAKAIPDKIDTASLQQVATSLGIAVDKMQLLRGKPTGIIDDASLTDHERADRIATLLDRARARRDGSAAASDPADHPAD